MDILCCECHESHACMMTLDSVEKNYNGYTEMSDVYYECVILCTKHVMPIAFVYSKGQDCDHKCRLFMFQYAVILFAIYTDIQ